jgi:hypothetical protein
MAIYVHIFWVRNDLFGQFVVLQFVHFLSLILFYISDFSVQH